MMRRIMLKMHNICNYRCWYCTLDKTPKNRSDPYNIGHHGCLLEKLMSLEGTFSIFMSGGEPTITPDLVDFCRELTRKHKISFITNLGLSHSKLKKFVAAIPPDKVEFIYSSFQPQAEEKFDEYYSKVKYLKEQSYPIFVRYCASPDRINRLEYYRRKFEDNIGVLFDISVLTGAYRFRIYPGQYSRDEKMYLKNHIFSLTTYNALLMGAHGFKTKGILCEHFYPRIDVYTGDVWSCGNRNIYLGNFLGGSFRVPSKQRCNVTQPCKCDIIKPPHQNYRELAIGTAEKIDDNKYLSFIDDLKSIGASPLIDVNSGNIHKLWTRKVGFLNPMLFPLYKNYIVQKASALLGQHVYTKLKPIYYAMERIVLK